MNSALTGSVFSRGLKTDGKFLPSCSKIWKSSRPRCSALLLLYFTLVVRRLEAKKSVCFSSSLRSAVAAFSSSCSPIGSWMWCCEILTRTHTHSHARISHKGGEQFDEKEPKPKKTETRKRMCPCMGGFGSPQPAFRLTRARLLFSSSRIEKKANFRLIPRSFLAKHFKLRRIQENQIHGKLFRERKHFYCIERNEKVPFHDSVR